MSVLNNVIEVLHRIRAKLYPNYLHTIEGAYIARTDDEAALSIEQVCAALKARGGGTASYDDYVEHVKQFFDESAYQLCDGYSINTGYYSIHPRIGGTWASATEPYDRAKHPVSFSFRVLKPLRDLASRIEVLIEGVANVSGFIAEVTDVTSEAVNETLTPNGMFALSGSKVKVAGADASCGVYFVSAADANQRIKVTGNLADNTASRIVGMIPALAAGQYKLEVVTQFSAGSFSLKEPRTIAFAPILTVP